MPRPATSIFEWDVRITPTDQLPITDWSVFAERSDTKVIAAEEGGTNDLRLHYHVYVWGRLSETYLRSVVSVLGRATQEVKGNAVYSVRKAHEGTIGYVVKTRNVVFRQNYNQTHIDDFMEQSAQYKKDLEAAKKREVRKKQSFLQEVIAKAKTHFGSAPRHVNQVYDYMCHEYGERPMPSRSILETAIVNIMPDAFKEKYYLKNIIDILV